MHLSCEASSTCTWHLSDVLRTALATTQVVGTQFNATEKRANSAQLTALNRVDGLNISLGAGKHRRDDTINKVESLK